MAKNAARGLGFIWFPKGVSNAKENAVERITFSNENETIMGHLSGKYEMRRLWDIWEIVPRIASKMFSRGIQDAFEAFFMHFGNNQR